jgi:hypothetical protein
MISSRGGLALTLVTLALSCAPADPVTPRPVADYSADAPARARDFFVSPDGSALGDGSFAKPWDLATALAGPAVVTPGSTIWLRGGTYADGSYFGHGYLSTLTGAPEAPIVVRQYPGEHATITKFLTIQGADTWYWGFEVMHPPPHVGYAFGINNHGPRTKLINVVVHDASGSGIVIGPQATDAEVYGSIVYNNGRTDKFDHGIYCQSNSSLSLRDNIVFTNWAVGIHCYVEPEHGPDAALQNISVSGNVAFDNSVWGVAREDILVGGERPASGITIDRNYTYRSTPSAAPIADIGYNFLVNQDVVLTNNYFVGGWLHVGRWTAATVTGNTLFDFTTGPLLWLRGAASGQTWSDNTFFGDSAVLAWRYDSNAVTTFDEWLELTALSEPGAYAGPMPTDAAVVLRPNAYEQGRANIIVYDWPARGSGGVDVADILRPGDCYVVRNAQDFYGAPVASGIYTHRVIQLPMVRVIPPAPLGASTTSAAPSGPTFNVFVLMTATPGQDEAACQPSGSPRPRPRPRFRP